MARAIARQDLPEANPSRFVSRRWRKTEDIWPDEPTAVDAAMTMEEMIVDELGRAHDADEPANDPKKETPAR
jgi:hypothetical protein